MPPSDPSAKPIPGRLLEMLACPISKQPLAMLSDEKRHALNAQIQSGLVTNIGGETLKTALEQALITHNGTTIYPLENGIPIMLESKGISIHTLEKL